jgi:hypothetical protein
VQCLKKISFVSTNIYWQKIAPASPCAWQFTAPLTAPAVSTARVLMTSPLHLAQFAAGPIHAGLGSSAVKAETKRTKEAVTRRVAGGSELADWAALVEDEADVEATRSLIPAQRWGRKQEETEKDTFDYYF